MSRMFRDIKPESRAVIKFYIQEQIEFYENRTLSIHKFTNISSLLKTTSAYVILPQLKKIKVKGACLFL